MALAPTVKLQQDAKAIVDLFEALRWKALNTYNIYWKTSANLDINGLGSAGTAASLASRLTKSQCQNMALVLADQLGNNFFENVAVVQGDYMTDVESLLYGNVTGALVSVPAEAFCTESKQLAYDALSLYLKCRELSDFYAAQGIAAILSPLAGSDSVTPDGVTKDEFLAVVELVAQFQNFVNNAAVSAASYKTTLGLWARY